MTGIAGIGKSRLAWEFYKYFDGIAETVYWHRGRCLSYGEGVTYWALADMVRMRCRIAEDEEPGVGAAKLRATLEEHILDPEERAFLEPRLAQLLGLAEHEARDQQDLFAAWRLFFERLADAYPTVLAFEDMQWADASLLDFVEYLLDWSRNSPLFVVTLARPGAAGATADLGRRAAQLHVAVPGAALEQAMEELLTGLVPGLPAELREQILARAEGIPLYAVETVRMLLDQGLLVQEGAVVPADRADRGARGAGDAARADRRPARRAAGSRAAAAAGRAPCSARPSPRTRWPRCPAPEADVEPLLASLVRKEVLGVQADPRSPEHGQYGFLQDLVRHVAYETLVASATGGPGTSPPPRI